jgi:hypothetical protein
MIIYTIGIIIIDALLINYSIQGYLERKRIDKANKEYAIEKAKRTKAKIKYLEATKDEDLGFAIVKNGSVYMKGQDTPYACIF